MFKFGPIPEVSFFGVEWGSQWLPHAQWLDWMQANAMGYGRVYPGSSPGWTPHMRIAIVCRADDPHAHFFETVAKNSKRNVEPFTGYAQARDAIGPSPWSNQPRKSTERGNGLPNGEGVRSRSHSCPEVRP